MGRLWSFWTSVLLACALCFLHVPERNRGLFGQFNEERRRGELTPIRLPGGSAVEFRSMESAALGGSQPYSIFLPPSFSKEHIDYVVARARNVLVDLETWIGYDASKDEIGRNYAGEGMKLFELGIPLCEAHRALVVLRRMLWNFVEIESDFDTMFELSQIRELSDRVILFFDRALYYLIRGYSEEMNRRMKSLWKLTDEDTDKIFFE